MARCVGALHSYCLHKELIRDGLVLVIFCCHLLCWHKYWQSVNGESGGLFLQLLAGFEPSFLSIGGEHAIHLAENTPKKLIIWGQTYGPS